MAGPSKRQKTLGPGEVSEWFWDTFSHSEVGLVEDESHVTTRFIRDSLIGRKSSDGKSVSVLECSKVLFYRTRVHQDSTLIEEVDYWLASYSNLMPLRTTKEGMLHLSILDHPGTYFVVNHQFRGSAAYANEYSDYPKQYDTVDPGGKGLLICSPLIYLHAYYRRQVDYLTVYREYSFRLRLRTVWIPALEYGKLQLQNRSLIPDDHYYGSIYGSE